MLVTLLEMSLICHKFAYLSQHLDNLDPRWSRYLSSVWTKLCYMDIRIFIFELPVTESWHDLFKLMVTSKRWCVASALRKKGRRRIWRWSATSVLNPSILLDDHGSTVSYESVVVRPMVLKCSRGIIMKMMVGRSLPVEWKSKTFRIAGARELIDTYSRAF